MREPVHYTARLVAFAFRTNPALYLALLLALLSVCTELAAMTSLLPLAALALDSAPPADSVVVRALGAAGLAPSFITLVSLFVGLFALRLVTQLASQAMAMLYGRRLLAQLASRAFDSIIKGSSIRDIEKNSIGYFISLAGDESFRASTIVISLMQLVSIVALAALYFAAILAYSPWVALAVCVFLALSGLLLLDALRRSQSLGHLQIEQSRSAGSLFLDALNGLRAVRAFSAEAFVASNYASRMNEYVHTLFRIDFINLLSRFAPAAILLFGFLAVVLTMPAGESALAPATAVTILVLLLRFFPVTGQALTILLRVIADTKAARDVVTVAASAERTAAPAAGRKLGAGGVQSIVFSGASFAHTPGRPVLRDFSVRLQRGRAYALAGPSGSGKSTMFDLLLRFYDLQGGAILIDGVPIGEVALQELRRCILLVGQQTVVFNDSVENNVRFGSGAAADKVRWACRLACLDEVIAALPQGYQTVLNYQGTNLSGGQRQRLGLARALLRQPDVLLLDEVTSGLDHETRDKVVANVLQEFRSKIVVFSTHDRDLAAKVDETILLQPLTQAEAPTAEALGA